MRFSSAAICSSSTNTLRSPAWVKSTWLANKRGGRDALVALRRHVGERDGEQRAADAIADGVDLGLAGRLLDGVERGERALAHVVLEALVAELRVRIDPGDAEHREALVDAPFDEGLLRREIEHVELVDPGRHDQQRPLAARSAVDGAYWMSCISSFWKITLPGVTARLRPTSKLRASDWRILQIAAAGLDVLGQHVHAAREVLGVRGQRLAQQLRIGQHEIRRRRARWRSGVT